ncbi:ABC transporter substrate-binding protein [Haladaptatus caseinilyticus]|uniref:ABC transporter substrate-binding protein n=1 Tax=Haladaptatus caseinilyticus TaxID=2993314 RepID=UPI00224AF911|nr:ABC transporter substrate-binding protein [Haladaptatus caseinilyticus]
MLPKQNSKPSTESETGSKTGRRELLAAVGITLGSGCVNKAKSLVSRDQSKQITFSIKTLPADADPQAIRIARFLAKRLNEVGIAVQIEPMERVELLREILLEQSFDCYVACHPGIEEPDALRTLLHSQFDTEVGWQNPFGYANLNVDRLLNAQRRQQNRKRLKTLGELQHAIARNQPFSVVAFPDEIRAARKDTFAKWGEVEQLHSPLGYLSVQTQNGKNTLRMTLQDSRPTENLNPLSAEFRGDGTIVDLLYDRLGQWIDGKVRPWLAQSWEWKSSNENLIGDVRLRDDLEWHDGNSLTSNDVAFTYRFLNDTALSELKSPVPSPRFRDAATLVESTSTVDDQTVRIRFGTASREVAMKSLAVPVLPKHIWWPKRKQAEIVFQTDSTATKALVWNNLHPVGSGPFQFSNAKKKESLTLEQFEEHFLHHVDTAQNIQFDSNGPRSEPNHIKRYAGKPDYKRLRFIVVPSGAAATSLVLNDEADGTATSVSVGDVRDIGRAESVQLKIDESTAMYHVGYNARKRPFSNVRFRRAVAQLLDKEFLVDDVFGGYAKPAASPLARHDSLVEDLRWEGDDPKLPFPGTNGNLDRDKARTLFTNAGFKYSNDGEILQR